MRHRVACWGMGVAAMLVGTVAMSSTAAGRGEESAALHCNQLVRLYQRYLPERAYGSSMGASVGTETSVALTLCNDGRAPDAIPELEETLRNAGFTVPKGA